MESRYVFERWILTRWIEYNAIVFTNESQAVKLNRET